MVFVDKQNKAMKELSFVYLFCAFFWRENERGTSNFVVCFDDKKRGIHCSNVRITATMRIDNRVGVANGMAFSLKFEFSWE